MDVLFLYESSSGGLSQNQFPKEIFTSEFKNPITDSSGFIRSQLQEATKLLKESGWILNDGKLQNNSSKKLFEWKTWFGGPWPWPGSADFGIVGKSPT